MELKYRYNAVEILNCSAAMVCLSLKKLWKLWLALAAIITAIDSVKWLIVFLGGGNPNINVLGFTKIYLLMFAWFLMLHFLALVFSVGKRFHGVQMKLSVRDGKLVTKIGESRWWRSCNDVVGVTRRGRLVIIELKQKGKKTVVILLPNRAFASRKEARQFVDYIKEQKEYAHRASESDRQCGTAALAGCTDRENGNEPADFDFEIQRNEEFAREINAEVSWIGTQKGFSGERNQLLCLIGGAVWLTMFLGELRSKNGDLAGLIISGIAVALALVLMIFGQRRSGFNRGNSKSRLFSTPKSGQKQKAESLPDTRVVAGKQHLFISEGETEAELAWKDLGYLLESGRCFLLYNKKKRAEAHFPKESLGEEEEQHRFVEYCRERGLEYRKMRQETEAGKQK